MNRKQSARRARERKTQGLVRLQSPWGWLGVTETMNIAAAAYRVASYESRHVQARDVAGVEPDPDGFNQVTTEHLTMQRMRECFVEHLVEAFEDLLRAAAVERGACWPGSDYSRLAALFVEGVPADWRPQYPQFGTPEPGKICMATEDKP
jgi:hypothetical protein